MQEYELDKPGLCAKILQHARGFSIKEKLKENYPEVFSFIANNKETVGEHLKGIKRQFEFIDRANKDGVDYSKFSKDAPDLRASDAFWESKRLFIKVGPELLGQMKTALQPQPQ